MSKQKRKYIHNDDGRLFRKLSQMVTGPGFADLDTRREE